jgi:hypothetical protein
LYPGILVHTGHSSLQPPPNFLVKVHRGIARVAFARNTSSRVSSNGVTPARVKSFAREVSSMVSPGRREVDADGTRIVTCALRFLLLDCDVRVPVDLVAGRGTSMGHSVMVTAYDRWSNTSISQSIGEKYATGLGTPAEPVVRCQPISLGQSMMTTE